MEAAAEGSVWKQRTRRFPAFFSAQSKLEIELMSLSDFCLWASLLVECNYVSLDPFFFFFFNIVASIAVTGNMIYQSPG